MPLPRYWGSVMKQIDADLLKEHLDNICTSGGIFGRAEREIIKAVKKVIDKEPAVKGTRTDGYNLIRCKKCEYFSEGKDKFGDCGVFHHMMYVTDYCSFGERRNGSDNGN